MYVLPAEGFGGAERQGVMHIRRLRQLGLSVLPVVGPGREICRVFEEEGIEDYVYLEDYFHELARPLSAWGELRGAARSAQTWFSMQRQLARLIVEREIDLVFANRSYGWIVSSPVARRFGLPLIWRGGSRPTGQAQRASLKLYALVWRPDVLVCNCEAVRDGLAPLIPSPSMVLPNGVDTERFRPGRVQPRFRRQLGIAPDVPVVGLAARPSPEKGLELLADVVGLTSREVPRLRVLIGGEFGWRRHYQELFRDRGLLDRVEFLGHVPDVESLYQSCEVVLLTSRDHSIEGSPNAVLEAMAMERPVVVTRVGGLAELVEEGVSGYLVPDNEPIAFSRRLVPLLRDPELARRLGRAGRSAVLKNHEERVIADRLARLLRAVMTARAGQRTLPLPRAQLGTG